MTKSSVATLVLFIAASGCVSSGKYDEAVASAERAAAELRSTKLRAAERDDQLAKLSGALTAVDARNAQQAAELQSMADRFAATSQTTYNKT